MHLQIDMLDAQINHRPDGSIEIHGLSGYIVLKAEYAARVRAEYEKLLKAYPTEESLKIALNIEVPQPIGQFVNEDGVLYAEATDRALHEERSGQNRQKGYDLFVDEP